MPLFSKNKTVGVRTVILKLVNNNCPELRAMIEGPRADSRVNLVVVATIVPVEGKQPQFDRAFTVVTKEFSSTGVGVVLDRPRPLHEAILGFRLEKEMTFLRAEAKHLSPLGGGFFQLGFRLTEVVSVNDYPELRSVSH
jgi:hypothetical protein